MDFQSYLKYFTNTLDTLDQHEIDSFLDLLIDAYENDRMVFIIGNGGSAANASHFANDLSARVR
jgi:D-sedoheptulose 7-phosphate isomerase